MNPDILCPVCGYALNQPPWCGESASFEICPSCGIHFGYDDDVSSESFRSKPETYRCWRETWITAGMPWFSKGRDKPKGWNPLDQLARLHKI
ncbi:MAG: hypothetical protein DCC58_10200 [Chloroflexi bacterium]|nr:MAG: hypothetical protein DCC58_10200 [Chloroflexota bacterium]